jgi:hypothetical protein
MAGLCAAGALVSALFVSNHRTAAGGLRPHPRTHACALPLTERTEDP